MKRIFSAVALRVILYPLVIGLLVSLYTFTIYAFPKRIVSKFDPGQWKIEYQDAGFVTKDGLRLAAWFVPHKKSRKVVIVCHGYPADKGDIFGVTDFLPRYYNVLYFDFRGMGKSQGRLSTSGWREKEDFLAAVRFLKSKGFRHIGAFGFSMGAAAILMANSPDVKCIVSDSSYARLTTPLEVIFRRYGLLRGPLIASIKFWSRLFLRIDIDSVAPVEYISKMKIPVLLLHCKTDTFIPSTEAEELHKAYPKSRLMMIPSGTHGDSCLSVDYEREITEFFRKNL